MAYYSQNAPLGTPYQPSTTESANDNGAGDYPTLPTGEPSGSNDANLANPPGAEVAEQHRRCSVRGCVSIIPAESTNKMCEACRGRHRVYAMTKRAKRKMEKEALSQQSVALLSNEQPPGTIWLPERPELDGVELHDESPSGARDTGKSPDRPSQPVATAARPSNSQSVPYSVPQQPASWDHTVLDPRLVSSQSSELAGALTLPSQSTSSADATPHVPTENDSTSMQTAQASSADEGTDSHDVDAPYVAPAGTQSSSSSPSRFCSVKGCKAMIPGDYFFKMCEPCRDRYRGYGITKRAKWRAERVAANAELEALRIEEDKRRADEGLPPLAESPEDWIAWQNDLVEGPLLTQTEDKYGPFPARMCTVSHCHAILPGQYKYRRCEQHRLQNRHHSKLKRVREKEVKAIVAALSSEPSDEFRIWEPRGESSKRKDDEVGPLFTNVPMDLDRSTRAESGDDISEAGDETPRPPSPSAAGGTRRTNHVCSIKGCHNLLAPQIPWKMCDNCREHDRENRKNKKLRDLGQLPPLRFQTNTGVLKKGGKSKGSLLKSASTGVSEPAPPPLAPVSSTLPEGSVPGPSSVRPSPSDEADKIYDDLVYLEGSANDIPSSEVGGDTSTFQQQNDMPIQRDTAATDDISGHASTTPQNPVDIPNSSEDPQPRKKRGKNRTKETHDAMPAGNHGNDEDANATVPTNSQAVTSNQAPMSFPYGPPYGPHMYAPYQVPYYVPPAHYGMPAQPPAPSPPVPESTSAAASTPQITPPPSQQMYPYPPQPYGHYPPYGQHPYPYMPPQYNPSQPHLQPYGTPVYPGIPPYSYVAPQTSLPKKPRPSKPIQRRKRKRDEQELPGPNGSTSYTSVFSARHTSPAPTQDPKPTLTVEVNIPPEPQETTGERDVASTSQRNGSNVSSVHEATRRCTGSSCHRELPVGTNGPICERCRERMKKRQFKAKQRFKLEPRKVIVRPRMVRKEDDPAADHSSGNDVV